MRKYYDEDNPPPLAKPAKDKPRASETQAEANGQMADVDMDGEEEGEEERKVPSADDDLASSMKVLRLKGH